MAQYGAVATGLRPLVLHRDGNLWQTLISICCIGLWTELKCCICRGGGEVKQLMSLTKSRKLAESVISVRCILPCFVAVVACLFLSESWHASDNYPPPRREIPKHSNWGKPTIHQSLVVFFILPAVTRDNPGIYLAFLFYHPGKKIAHCLPGW